LGSFLFQPVITEPSDALNALKQLRKEMASREQLFADQNVRNIDEYMALGGKEVPRIVVIIDELADLVLSHADIETELVILAQKARSSGIHLILATQRPDAKTFTGLLRSNIPSRIAMTVQKASESKIILDETGAENLTGYGDMIIKLSGRKTIRVHGYHVQKPDIDSTVNEARGK
jgi:S-DNA-T family DNA segregation ATPase FtsK/SpoIIIE